MAHTDTQFKLAATKNIILISRWPVKKLALD